MREIYLPSYKAEMAGMYLTPREQRFCENLILLAKNARAYPSQSGFFVRTAGIAKDGTTFSGGNKEYGHSDAFIHGETAVLSGLLDSTDSPVMAIAWYKDRKSGEKVTPHDFGCPCGNCRDIMSHYCDPNLILLNGNETGIVFSRLKDYLFTDFKQVKINQIDVVAASRALEAADMAVDAYLPDHMKKEPYGAVLVSADGTEMWPGIHYANAGYDSVTPILSAIIGWENNIRKNRKSESGLCVNKVVIAGRGNMPNPFYRDRQALLELDEVLRRYRKDNKSIEVQIIQRTDSGEIYASKTNAREWLPNPFSAGTFGMESVLDKQLAKLIKL